MRNLARLQDGRLAHLLHLPDVEYHEQAKVHAALIICSLLFFTILSHSNENVNVGYRDELRSFGQFID